MIRLATPPSLPPSSPPSPPSPPSLPPPSPPPPSPPLRPPDVLGDLNRDWSNESGGVLIKVVDGHEDEVDAEWHPCLSGWCSNVDHVSGSLLNRCACAHQGSHTICTHLICSCDALPPLCAPYSECGLLSTGGCRITTRGTAFVTLASRSHHRCSILSAR